MQQIAGLILLLSITLGIAWLNIQHRKQRITKPDEQKITDELRLW